MAARKNKNNEKIRNILLILFALAVMLVFFNLDIMRSGESVFSRTASKKLTFTGDLGRRDYSEEEVDALLRLIKRHTRIIDTTHIECSVQDRYKKLTDTSQILFEIHMVMQDGARISTPVRRTTRKHLVQDIIAKFNKDISAYKKLIKDGKKVNSLVNTM
ncbi:hypothetical protein [Pseudodesulfovibrio piezophilus]|uniref:Uncharacterized protein n=1 Tax=Pseudodesulfovibrio piezophilus (strain DSM 21447 / JCM 15486 / C1TLV30) TaxID=1322246 RepID=M1WR35_PSEP2|nr:hypothetical protein [Pseudodesulfovibrio piezophilus]CCH49324.1 conserved protein of unknown function [Pseudodesulfovibrio piezophilus C1TLV30]